MNEIDDIFKEAAKEQQATFKPEFWDQYAEQFSGEKKKRKSIFGFFFLEMLFISCIGLLVYNVNSNQYDSNLAENATPYTIEQSIEKSNLEELAKNNKASNTPRNTEQINNSLPVMLSTAQAELQKGQNKAAKQSRAIKTATVFSAQNNTASALATRSTKNSTQRATGIKTRATLEKSPIAKPSFASQSVEEIKATDKVEVVSEKPKQNTKEETGTNLLAAEPVEKEIPAMEDSATKIAEEPKSKTAVVTQSRMKKLQYNFQIGTNVYNDFNLLHSTKNIKTGLLVGVEAEYRLKPNLTISLGVNGYNRVSDGLFINFDYLDKGFGEVDSKRTYSYTDLYFVEVPVALNYVINSRHKIGAGATFTRLLTTKVNVKEETKDTKSSEATSTNSDQFMYHYNTFELNNTGINVNYQYMFKRVGINIGYTQGLNEFLNKETFNSTRLNSLSKLSLSIKYKL